MDYRRFEQEFLQLAFTSTAELTPSALAFVTGVSIDEATTHMSKLVDNGVLELSSDAEGHLKYVMPDRPEAPYQTAKAVLAPPRAIVVRNPSQGLVPEISSGQAVASMFLNAMVCPGVGSLVGGKTRAGIGQLSLFLLGLPLVVVVVGLPLMIASWTWGIATGAQLIAEARNRP